MTCRCRCISRFMSIVVLLLGGPNAFAWTDKDYDKFDYRAFERLPAVNQPIDMKRVDRPLLNAAIFYETNRQRALLGRRGLRHSPLMEKVAAGHSEDMARYNFFSHRSPVKGKEDLIGRINSEGQALRNVTIGENIGDVFGIEYESGKRVYPPDNDRRYFSREPGGKPLPNRTYIGLAKEAVAEWMHSPRHRENILNDAFQYLGAGAAHYADPDFYDIDRFKMTQNFFGEIAVQPEKNHNAVRSR